MSAPRLEIDEEPERALLERGYDLNDPDVITIVQTLWPYLYAFAVRDGASRVERRAAFDPGMRGTDAVRVLLKLADGA